MGLSRIFKSELDMGGEVEKTRERARVKGNVQGRGKVSCSKMFTNINTNII